MRLEKELVIRNRTGFHVTVAGKFVKLAAKFDANISVRSDAFDADGKSIMDLLQLDAGPGSALTVRAEGSDAEEAMRVLFDFLTANLGVPSASG